VGGEGGGRVGGKGGGGGRGEKWSKPCMHIWIIQFLKKGSERLLWWKPQNIEEIEEDTRRWKDLSCL
jgi:hypothetical protein